MAYRSVPPTLACFPPSLSQHALGRQLSHSSQQATLMPTAGPLHWLLLLQAATDTGKHISRNIFPADLSAPVLTCNDLDERQPTSTRSA